MSRDNEKMIKDIMNKVENNISKSKLEEILYDTVRQYHVEKIDNKKYNLKEIISLYKTDMEIQEYAKNTIKNRMYFLNNFINFVKKDIEDITIVDLKAYLNMKRKTTIPSTINGFIASLKAFFTWAVEEGYIDINPANRLRKTKVGSKLREPLSIENIERLRIACKTNRERALVEFLLATGMRVSEVVNVNVSDLDFYENKLKTTGKGNKERFILFNDKCKLYLKEYLDNRKGESDALFIAERKPFGRMGARALEKLLKKISERKITDTNVFPHKLRHTFATQLFSGGANITTIQFLLGHESITTTQRYVKTSFEKVNYEYNKCLAI